MRKNRLGRRKSQSAMEYLMTYGWAILIIAVVLGTLFQLGVFNTSNLTPKAPPGSCKVFRPAGPGTTSNLNLVGVCNGQLPQFVAQFNGQSSNVLLPSSTELTGAQTISLWLNPSGYNTLTTQSIFGGGTPHVYGNNAGIALSNYNNFGFYFSIENAAGGAGTYFTPALFPIHSWEFITMSWDGTANANAIKIYTNGALNGQGTGLTPPISVSGWQYKFYIGSDFNGYYFNGSISNVQIYNTSLDASSIAALYNEGIGGAPVGLQNLVGWWPLNGDTKDYSGNNNNGAPTAVAYISQYGK